MGLIPSAGRWQQEGGWQSPPRPAQPPTEPIPTGTSRDLQPCGPPATSTCSARRGRPGLPPTGRRLPAPTQGSATQGSLPGPGQRRRGPAERSHLFRSMAARPAPSGRRLFPAAALSSRRRPVHAPAAHAKPRRVPTPPPRPREAALRPRLVPLPSAAPAAARRALAPLAAAPRASRLLHAVRRPLRPLPPLPPLPAFPPRLDPSARARRGDIVPPRRPARREKLDPPPSPRGPHLTSPPGAAPLPGVPAAPLWASSPEPAPARLVAPRPRPRPLQARPRAAAPAPPGLPPRTPGRGVDPEP